MSKKEKLIKRLKSRPKDFSFDEAEVLLNYFSFELTNKGKTSGSRIMFINKNTGIVILLHKPHPNNILKDYQIRQLITILEREGLI